MMHAPIQKKQPEKSATAADICSTVDNFLIFCTGEVVIQSYKDNVVL